jgi:hypothetical protein
MEAGINQAVSPAKNIYLGQKGRTASDPWPGWTVHHSNGQESGARSTDMSIVHCPAPVSRHSSHTTTSPKYTSTFVLLPPSRSNMYPVHCDKQYIMVDRGYSSLLDHHS